MDHTVEEMFEMLVTRSDVLRYATNMITPGIRVSDLTPKQVVEKVGVNLLADEESGTLTQDTAVVEANFPDDEILTLDLKPALIEIVRSLSAIMDMTVFNFSPTGLDITHFITPPGA